MSTQAEHPRLARESQALARVAAQAEQDSDELERRRDAVDQALLATQSPCAKILKEIDLWSRPDSPCPRAWTF